MRMRRFLCRGISLIEILVVIAIIGLLISLLLPAIQMARESARRALCANNLRQFGIALTNFEGQNGAFPAGMTLTIKGPLGSNPEIHSYNFLTEILPFIEEVGVANSYHRDLMFTDPKNASAIAAQIPIAICPSTPVEEQSTTMTFMPSLLIRSSNEPSLIDPIMASLDAKYTATFTGARSDYTVAVHGDRQLSQRLGYKNLDSLRELPGIFRLPTSDELMKGVTPLLFSASSRKFGERTRAASITDGLTHTFTMFEMAGRPQHWVSGLRDTSLEPLTNVWSDPRLVIKLRPKDGSNRLINEDNNDHAYSFHPGGAHFVFADAHVEFLQEDLEPRLLLSLLTPNEGDDSSR